MPSWAYSYERYKVLKKFQKDSKRPQKGPKNPNKFLKISKNVCNSQPGGDYTYILDSLGPFIGFVRLWAECLIVRPCTITIVALTFAKYSVKLIFPECEPPDDSVRMLAAVCICEIMFSLFGSD